MSGPACVETTVSEMIDKANTALAVMSPKNGHRALIYQLATGLSQVADMVGERDAEIAALKTEVWTVKGEFDKLKDLYDEAIAKLREPERLQR